MGWASKGRNQIIESDEESVQEESVTRCICGEQHNIGLMVQCDKCEVWQHCECMNLEEEDIPDQYFCEQCRSTDKLESYKPLSPESDIEKRNIIEVSNDTDSDALSTHELGKYEELRRLKRTARATTKRIDKKQQQQQQQQQKRRKRSNKTPPSRTTTPQPQSTNNNFAFCREKSQSIKVRLPNARMTLQEMSTRANQILEYIYTMQLEMRSQKTFEEDEEEEEGKEQKSAGTKYPTPRLIHERACSPSSFSMSSASTIPLDDSSSELPIKRTEPSSLEMMDILTRDLIHFQQRFGYISTEE